MNTLITQSNNSFSTINVLSCLQGHKIKIKLQKLKLELLDHWDHTDNGHSHAQKAGSVVARKFANGEGPKLKGVDATIIIILFVLYCIVRNVES